MNYDLAKARSRPSLSLSIVSLDVLLGRAAV